MGNANEVFDNWPNNYNYCNAQYTPLYLPILYQDWGFNGILSSWGRISLSSNHGLGVCPRQAVSPNIDSRIIGQ